MNSPGFENLKSIHFAGQLLPQWTQLLDLAARLCPVPEETRRWFSRFSNSSGMDDSRTIAEHCVALLQSLKENHEAVMLELQRSRDDIQPAQMIHAWNYALNTMLQEARIQKTCSWIIEGADDTDLPDSDGGDISLRRV